MAVSLALKMVLVLSGLLVIRFIFNKALESASYQTDEQNHNSNGALLLLNTFCGIKSFVI